MSRAGFKGVFCIPFEVLGNESKLFGTKWHEDVPQPQSQRDEIADMAEQFQRLHREILEEECQERQLVERGLA